MRDRRNDSLENALTDIFKMQIKRIYNVLNFNLATVNQQKPKWAMEGNNVKTHLVFSSDLLERA